MSCTPMINPPVTDLPSGTTITPPSPPPLPGDVTLCCKALHLPTFPPLIPLPIALPGLSEVISAFLAGITKYIDSLPIVCPKE